MKLDPCWKEFCTQQKREFPKTTELFRHIFRLMIPQKAIILDIDTVAQYFLDAAVDPSLWTRAMDAAARYAGAGGAVLLPVRGRLAMAPHSQSLVEAYKDYVKEGWYLRDERERGLAKMRQTGIFADQDFASPEELKSSDYYRGFLARHSINWSAGIGVNNGEDELCLMLERGDKEGYFSENEQDRLLKLAMPIRQAALLGHHLSYGKAVGMNDAFDLIGSASILINRFGKVFRCNKTAEQYFGDGLSLTGNELSCALSTDTTALRRMIFSCCTENKLDEFELARSLVIQRPSKRPLVIQVVRLTGMVGDIFSPARVLLFVVDPFQERNAAQTSELRKVFKLTAAEAALLAILETEMPLPKAAEQLGISYETARTQIKSIMQKTGKNRQSEVIALVRRMSIRVK
jgi:DNA-binding CsgD family transcriptional regulator